MKLYPPQTLESIAGLLKCEYVGPANHPVTGINEIHVVEEGDIVFVDHPKYYEKALHSRATTIIINKKVECPQGKGLLISDDPCRDFNFLNRHFRPETRQDKMIGNNTKISSSAFIYPNVFIGHNVTIGDHSVIYPGTVIADYSVIGKHVIIHPNAVIGGEAFYYKKREGVYDKMHTCGRVIIEDYAEIGAGTTIDRGLTGDTRIGEGTKLDNHVHIGHDTVIGKHCLMAAQVGVAGCVVIEDHVTLWGQVGIASGITIGRGAVVLAQSGVGMNLAPGGSYFGSPAGESRMKMREIFALKNLPEYMSKNK